eukprot:scaffold244116_cov23-Tisochrysis_lutea.AAC.1
MVSSPSMRALASSSLTCAHIKGPQGFGQLIQQACLGSELFDLHAHFRGHNWAKFHCSSHKSDCEQGAAREPAEESKGSLTWAVLIAQLLLHKPQTFKHIRVKFARLVSKCR